MRMDGDSIDDDKEPKSMMKLALNLFPDVAVALPSAVSFNGAREKSKSTDHIVDDIIGLIFNLVSLNFSTQKCMAHNQQ